MVCVLKTLEKDKCLELQEMSALDCLSEVVQKWKSGNIINSNLAEKLGEIKGDTINCSNLHKFTSKSIRATVKFRDNVYNKVKVHNTTINCYNVPVIN